VFAGVVVGLALLALLTTLWFALAFNSDVESVRVNLEWYVGITAIASLFIGGLLAGWLSGVRGAGSGLFNGITMWGLILIVAWPRASRRSSTCSISRIRRAGPVPGLLRLAQGSERNQGTPKARLAERAGPSSTSCGQETLATSWSRTSTSAGRRPRTAERYSCRGSWSQQRSVWLYRDRTVLHFDAPQVRWPAYRRGPLPAVPGRLPMRRS
jgi:hypothetical protein